MALDAKLYFSYNFKWFLRFIGFELGMNSVYDSLWGLDVLNW